MPGSTDQEIHMTGNEQPQVSSGKFQWIDRTQNPSVYKSTRRRNGYDDWFFLMNGFCVSIVSQVIKSNKVTTKVTMDQETGEMESSPDDSQQTKLSAPQFSRSPTPSPHDRKTSLTASRQASFDHSRRCSTSVSQENSAMIRHNLLGPLSFDDLHYM
uniref:Uncharacterized protein n=1 Tax=Caenorhabditis tropicalis TaxID=1561998 RepID=A0A1I7T814_9PELO